MECDMIPLKWNEKICHTFNILLGSCDCDEECTISVNTEDHLVHVRYRLSRMSTKSKINQYVLLESPTRCNQSNISLFQK